MKFGSVAVGKAEGAILAHSAGGLKKGRKIGADDVAQLKERRIALVIVAQLTKNDVPEDEAARQIAEAICGKGASAHAPFTGRANLYADAAGLVIVDEILLTKINRVHEAITVACLKSHDRVTARQMLATVKIIPYAAPKSALAKVLRLLRGKKLVSVAAFTPHRVGLVITRAETTKPSLIAKSEVAVRERLVALGSELAEVITVDHSAEAAGKAIAALHAEGLSLILVFGASAISDREDVVPAALKRVKGKVIHLGMPVDPGNLLMLGALGKTPVIGVPTCARSPKINGFDWVLNRLCAGLKVSREEVMAMGAGGLLAEITSRPQPREGGGTAPTRPRVAAIVLAAGLSSRMGSNKLLADFHGAPLIALTLEHVRAAHVDDIIVVTGHQAEEVEAALSGTSIRFVHNAAYADGLAGSVKTGVEAAAQADAALIILGDMPLIRSDDIDRMISAFSPEEGRTLIAPVHGRKLGHPVLWGRDYFVALRSLSGDRGARGLLEQHRGEIVEIEVEDDSILLDADTPEALEGMRGRG